MATLSGGLATGLQEVVEKGQQAVFESQPPSQIFAQELQYQVYRIENVLEVKDPEAVSAFVKLHPEYSGKPLLQSFFESYKNKDVSGFIESAKEKTQDERESLLEGIRKIIHDAKKEKQTVEVESKKEESEQDERIASLEGLLEREYTEEDFSSVERNMATPFDISKGNMDFNKVRYFYTSILTGQKAFGSHVQSMQEEYTNSVEKLNTYQKGFNSWGQRNLGVATWGWRKVKGIFRWGKKKITGRAESTEKDRINQEISKTKTFYAQRIQRVSQLKVHIENRTNELKEGLGVFRGDLREKIKQIIARGEWTQEQKKKSEQEKSQLEEKKTQLNQGLSSAERQKRELEAAKHQVGETKVELQQGLDKIDLSESFLGSKVGELRARIVQLENQYGKDDPRVKTLREEVLVGLLEGQDKIMQVRLGRSSQLSDLEKRNHQLDVMKADVYLNETNIVNQIEQTELGIKHTTGKIETLNQSRLELHKVLEGMETAYVVIDEFKVNVSKNLDEIGGANKKAVEGIEGQYEYLKQAKATEPGIGTALYNTAGIGRWGIMGALKGVNHIPSAIAYLFNGFKWKNAQKWTITGSLGHAQKWFDKKVDNLPDGAAWAPVKFLGGVASTALSLVNGVGTLVFETDKVLDSLEMMFTDWSTFKEALKGVIHYEDWKKGRYAAALGRSAGDLAVLFLTAGAAAGVKAAGTVGNAAMTAGKGAKVLAYLHKGVYFVGGFSKEVARQSLNLSKSILKLPFKLPHMAFNGIKNSAAVVKYLRTEGMQGLRNYLYDIRYKELLKSNVDDIQNFIKGLSDAKLQRLNLGTRQMIQNVFANPDKAGIQKLMGRLQTEFANGGWRVKQTIGPLQSRLRRHLRLDAKHMKGQEFLRNKYGSLNSARNVYKDAAVSQDIMTKYQSAKAELVEAQKMDIPKRGKGVTQKAVNEAKKKKAEAIKKAKDNVDKQRKSLMDRYDQMQPQDGLLEESITPEEAMFRHGVAESNLAKAKRAKGGKANLQNAQQRLAEEFKLLENVKGGVQDLFISTDDLILRLNNKSPQKFFEKLGMRSQIKEAIRKLQIEAQSGINVGNRISTLQVGLDAIKLFEKSAQVVNASNISSWAKLKNFKSLIQTKGVKEATRFLFNNVAAWPVWLNSRTFLRSVYTEIKASPKHLNPNKLVHILALSETAKTIQQLAKNGLAKEAVALYTAAKASAMGAGIPIAVLDKPFLAYLHRVMPASAMYLGRVEDLYIPEKIAKLPEKLDVDLKRMEELEKENIELMKQYIK